MRDVARLSRLPSVLGGWSADPGSDPQKPTVRFGITHTVFRISLHVASPQSATVRINELMLLSDLCLGPVRQCWRSDRVLLRMVEESEPRQLRKADV